MAFVTPGCSENITDSDIYFSQFHSTGFFKILFGMVRNDQSPHGETLIVGGN
jgi:hypothetical protein